MTKEKKDLPMDENGQISFLFADNFGHTTIYAEFRVNKKERPTIRTRAER